MSYYDDFWADHMPDEDAIYMQTEEEAKQGYWTMRNGETIHISDMTVSHIQNAIKHIEKHDYCDMYLPWVFAFKEELKRRGIN